MRDLTKSELYKKIIDEQNIFSAIYSIRSYVFEPELLSASDYTNFKQLYDVFDKDVISSTINKCKAKIEKIFKDPKELFECKIYFKIKSGGEEGCEYRQLHTSELISLISMVCMLNVIMFKDTESGRKLSNVADLLPSNFYGNIPSTNVNHIFVPWHKKYKQYSKNVISAYDTYKQSMKYKYEVVLDIKQFFPSVPPKFIYFILTEKLKVLYQKKEEFECLKQLIFKLLYFKVTNIDECYESYYRNKEKIINNSVFYNQGLPQGLPQSYFFGNLCMMELAKVYEKYLPGISFFYVDDSVIYTNLVHNNDYDNKQIQSVFDEIIENIENDFHEVINNAIKKIDAEVKEHSDSLNGLNEFESFMDYHISLHRKGKSSCTSMAEMKFGGKNFLRRIALEASAAGEDIRRSMDILEEKAICGKYKMLSEGLETELRMVEREIKKSDDDHFSLEQYKKQLIRYLKFFRYRYKRLVGELEENVELDSVESFTKRYQENQALADWFVDDIFIIEADMLIKSLPLHKKNEVIEHIFNIEKKLCKKKEMFDNLYYFEVFGKTKHYILIDRYKSLREFSNVNLNFLKSSNEKVILERMRKVIEEENELTIFSVPNYALFVKKNSASFTRNILNMYLSAILGVYLSDDIIIYKKNNRILTYYEYRILSYVRNKYFQMETYEYKLKEIIASSKKGHDHEKLDISLFAVIDHFVKYVKQPKLIDDLIVTHRYVAGIWRNGSQFLYFYTLHNQEHSAELIRSCVSITHNIGYWELKDRDYYLLFLASYLHDISLTEHPDFDSFLFHDQNSDIIFTEWRNELEKEIGSSSFKLIRTTPGKRIIRKYFEKVNKYFEFNIRSCHSKESAKLIRTLKELKFLTNEEREITAQISEAHGYDVLDVYKIKSQASNQLFSLKYLKIVLRLADLMDMSKDRVSLDILRKNIKNMPKDSKFHWISHSAINSCKVNTEYSFKKKTQQGTTYLTRCNFLEDIGIEISLNAKFLTTIEGSKCDFFQGDYIAEEGKLERIEIKTNRNKCENCIFSCRWMMTKNAFLFKEIKELEKYLKNLDNNNFETTIHVSLIFENDRALEPEYSDIVKGEIEKKALPDYL